MLAFTDPELARHLLEGAIAFAGGAEGMRAQLLSGAIAAAAEIDPRWAVELLKHMPPDDPAVQGEQYAEHAPPYAEAVAAVARRLLDAPEDREHVILADDYQWNWLAEEEDL